MAQISRTSTIQWRGSASETMKLWHNARMDFLQPTIPSDSLAYRIDARLKILALLAFSIAISLLNSWVAMGVGMALIIACAVAAQLSWRGLLIPLLPVAMLAAFAFAFGAWNHPTPEGLSAAGMIAVRMILLVEASFLVCLTSTSTQLMTALKQMLSPLRHVGVPVERIGFVLTLALRFIPYIAQEFLAVRHAQLARGSFAQTAPLKRCAQNVGLAFAATFIGLFRHGDAMAQAMDARCFGLGRNLEAK